MHTQTLSARSAAAFTLCCLIGAALFTPSAHAKTSVQGKWEDGAPRNQAFTRVLVVGVSPNVNQRCAFEFFMASRLKSDSVIAYRSCDVVREKTPLTLESIEEAIKTSQADAVLTTTLVSRSLEEQVGGSRDTRGTANYKAVGAGMSYGYYGGYGIPVIYGEFSATPEFAVAEGAGEVTSKFYQTQDKKLLYTLDTKARKLESTDSALQEIASAIATKLRKEKLTR